MSTPIVSVGDWIRPYSKGIWRVFRILNDFNEFRYSLREPKVRSDRTLVFSNRLVNDSWKRSFSTECSELSWVTSIPREERQRIHQLLRGDEKLRKAFEKFEGAPKPVDLVVNLRFGPLPGSDRERFKAAMSEVLHGPIKRGLILDEVLECVRAAGYEGCMSQNPTTATLQLVSPDHELRGREFVMREYRVLNF
ncbi:MAG: hypothetical protein GC160_00105 [Acidobacteria bacterium]|nr:hypothetical protein [Acidobacteriota bacterium]